jgi:hypothetical protein
MDKIHEAMRIFERMKNRLAERKSEKRLQDLFIKVHVYNRNIKIPLPNIYAISEIEGLYESIDKINLADPKQLAHILVLLENQENLEYARLSKEEKDDLVLKRMQEIPAGEQEDYVQAIYEVFLMLKKNSIRKQKGILQQALEILDTEKLPSG